jgi:tetratricopeptide (TPR) repeat protein
MRLSPNCGGHTEAAEQKRLRLIENICSRPPKPSPRRNPPRPRYLLLDQQKYPEAIKEFESALKLANQNARIHSDLGVLFRSANAKAKTNSWKIDAQFEEFAKAIDLDSNLLEALFN